MKISYILKNIMTKVNGLHVRRLGYIEAGSTLTFSPPNDLKGLIVMHGAYTSQTALYELYVNSSGATYMRQFATATTTTDFSITTGTNSVTISNTRASGYMFIDYIGINADTITV